MPCGIAGILRFDDRPIEPDRLARMLDTIDHRGPDGRGHRSAHFCALAHTRLSVIDLPGGTQPMVLPPRGGEGGLSLVFNGEIYNHRDLRRELETLGHRFVTHHCDSEVLLHGYRQWSHDLPARLEGMFAFALWDAGKRELFLCRDRIGKKPLWLRRIESPQGREVVFGSLILTVLAGSPGDAPCRIDRDALTTYLSLGYTMGQSLIQGIEEIPGGHWLRIDSNRRELLKPYWTPSPLGPDDSIMNRSGPEGHGVEAVLRQAVVSRLEADVPLGCFLSGGLDSSLIAALAQDHLRSVGGDALRTFTVAMPEAEFDESPKAQKVARHLGTRHTRMTAGDGCDVLADLGHLIRTTGEPTGDSSILPTYWLSKATRQHVKVALSGDGGDELFGGYDRYRAMELLTRYRRFIRPLPLGWLAKPGDDRPGSLRGRMHRFAAALRQGEPHQQYARMIRIFDDHHLAELLPGQGGSGPPLRDWDSKLSTPRAAMAWDFSHYLPFDLLRKVDRASMAVALEVRSPMLDRGLVELAHRLPDNVLLGRDSKHLLRLIASRHLPREIVGQDKRGFGVPIGRWFKTSLHDSLCDHLALPGLAALGLHHSLMRRLVDEHTLGRFDHTHRLFTLLSLAMWTQSVSQLVSGISI